MKSVNVRIDKIFEPASAVTATDIAALRPEIEQGNALLHSGEGKGNDFLGWVNLPSSITRHNSMRFRRQRMYCGTKPT